jgi:hypothetical protein
MLYRGRLEIRETRKRKGGGGTRRVREGCKLYAV